MCGIVGILNFKGEKVSPELLQQMVGIISHGGPDASGVYTAGPVGFGHARLSIIDLFGGQQPMSNGDQSLRIIFNGEIFNYVELCKELIQKGYRFATHSDTEVILHAYEDKGEECVHSFNGQWAFAIWDAKKRKLFFSRDRAGVRPLFYCQTAEAFIFASEVKSIFVHPRAVFRLT
jgi:asparagine synthase (glutamine-hydrolysing)